MKPDMRLRPGRLTRLGVVVSSVVVSSVVGLAFVACGDDAKTAAPGTTADVQDGREVQSAPAVLVKGFIFKPSPLEVKAGTEVTWTNEDQILHTVTAGVPGTKSGVFDQPIPERGAVFSFTFKDPGTFQYFCDRHNSMTGTVIVS